MGLLLNLSKYVRGGLEENIVKNTNTGAKRLVTAIFRHKDKMCLHMCFLNGAVMFYVT